MGNLGEALVAASAVSPQLVRLHQMEMDWRAARKAGKENLAKTLLRRLNSAREMNGLSPF